MQCTELTALEIDGTDIHLGSMNAELVKFLKQRVSLMQFCAGVFPRLTHANSSRCTLQELVDLSDEDDS